MNQPSPNDNDRRLRSRNWGVFLALLAFVALIYGVTIVKIKMNGVP